MDKRLERTEYFIKIAMITALRSTCHRGSVGCILVSKDNRIVSTGYNSSYPGSSHCIDGECLMYKEHCIRCLHAEQAACLKLERIYDHLKAYVTVEPCIHCYKILVNAGVKEIYYLKPYWDKPPAYLQLIKEIGIQPQQVLDGKCTIEIKS